MIKLWEWQVTCYKCDYKSRWYRNSVWARIVAISHARVRHPYGFCTISVRLQKRIRVIKCK